MVQLQHQHFQNYFEIIEATLDEYLYFYIVNLTFTGNPSTFAESIAI